MMTGKFVATVLQIVVLGGTVAGAAFAAWARLSRVPVVEAQGVDHEKRIGRIEGKMDFVVSGMEKLTRTKYREE